MVYLLQAFSILGVPLLVAAQVAGAPQVQLGKTTLIGAHNPTFNQDFFGGIPFAEPPIGHLRLRPPVPLALRRGTFDATNFGAACVQLPGGISGIGGPGQISEDCLTLNVFRPAGVTNAKKLPVMVFIYGGGFDAGSSNVFNASLLVAQSVARGTPILFASLNYRVGPLGFPQGAEAARAGALNLGLKDQLLALKWINRNIGAFGGDKSKVTVFGESAGAISIGVLYLNSRLEDLVRGAILESGAAGSTSSFPASHRQEVWNDFVAALPAPCSLSPAASIECLRRTNISVGEFQNALNISLDKATEQFPWVPTLDGPNGVYPDIASHLYSKGHFSKVPFIAGCNLDEGTAFTPNDVNSSLTIENAIVADFSLTPADRPALRAAAKRILDLYPDDPAVGSPYNTGNETFGLSSQYKRFAAITGDTTFHSVRRLLSQAATKSGVKNYVYHFTGPVPQIILTPPLGVQHGLELLYVYGFVDTLPGISPGDVAFSTQIMDYWISFAVNGDPNDGKGSQRTTWPRYNSLNPTLLELHQGNISVVPDTYRKAQIGFINSEPGLFRH